MNRITFEALTRIMYGITNHYHKWDKADIEKVEKWINKQDKTYCHLCGEVESNHYCTNETCAEYRRFE